MGLIQVGGVMQSQELALISIAIDGDCDHATGLVFGILGGLGINVDFLVGCFDREGNGSIGLCVQMEDRARAFAALDRERSKLNAREITVHPHTVVLSLFGPHFREKPLIAGTMFSTLVKAGVGILAIGTSISSLSCVIGTQDLDIALQALYGAFDIQHRVKSRPKDY